ncbi:hypothetical protein [Vulcanimicrobium alpinum]|uniref:hypothetical protein n=1 Tax=Vulcanimicrobium alpinum TaxID=3016050 RepID=UPI00295F597B|nr:hypothetical protein [Vulcanimicrobium alpinum]
MTPAVIGSLNSLPKDKTFANITHAIDGSWGIGEKAYTNDELGARIAAAQAAA